MMSPGLSLTQNKTSCCADLFYPRAGSLIPVPRSRSQVENRGDGTPAKFSNFRVVIEQGGHLLVGRYLREYRC